MILIVKNHSYDYEMSNIIRLFYPLAKIIVLNSKSNNNVVDTTNSYSDITITTIIDNSNYTAIFKSDNYNEEISIKNTDITGIMTDKKLLAKCLYILLNKITKKSIPFGLLTGIRPVKYCRSLQNKFKSKEKTKLFLKNNMLVNDEKIKLLQDILDIQEPLFSENEENSCSIYISIAFCKTRCSYCSFVSESVSKMGHLIDDYLKTLYKEMHFINEKIKKLSLTIKTIYIGGGTPTILTNDELCELLHNVNTIFNIDDVIEYTMEAGRVDTITKEKLVTIKKFGITRLNINPQTLNDDVLKEIGRTHTGKDVIDTFNLAKSLGFTNINMDLIAGLTGENFNSFKNSVDTILSLQPENITVHSLAFKRASNINLNNEVDRHNNMHEVEKMLNYTNDVMNKNNFKPYYLYKQKNTIGNFENVGYCKDGFSCIYNIFIMEECHNIFSLGAGAVTKLVNKGDIYRIFNYKLPTDYIKNELKVSVFSDDIDNFMKIQS